MRWPIRAALLFCTVFAACKQNAATTAADAGPAVQAKASPDLGDTQDTTKTSSQAECPRDVAKIVRVATDDGVVLEGELYTVGEKNRPAAVLLHMIPPANDRSNYPRAFIDKLLAKRINVLNLDRRGAGGSKGDARAAYDGDKGWLDVKASRAKLLEHACEVDPSRIALIGASNGTTSALDFTVRAASDEKTEIPAALVFLTGGVYTEKQTAMKDHRETLDSIPIMFAYCSTEEAWSVGFQGEPTPPAWLFRRYLQASHGTRMFTAKPESMDDVASFLEGMLQ